MLLGVPHTEIDAIVIDGVSSTLDLELAPGAVVHAYGWRDGPADLVRLLDAPDPPRFVVDVHLGALARHLRLLGLDTADPVDVDDALIAKQSLCEGRALLTRDIGLLKRANVRRGLWIRSTNPDAQAQEVIARFVGPHHFAPMTRCLVCNGTLAFVTRDEVVDQLPDAVRALETPFFRCAGCHQVFWQGTHLKGLLQRLRKLLPGVEVGT